MYAKTITFHLSEIFNKFVPIDVIKVQTLKMSILNLSNLINSVDPDLRSAGFCFPLCIYILITEILKVIE